MFDVYIGREGHGMSGVFGNRHPVGKRCPVCSVDGDVYHQRGEALAKFREDFYRRIDSDPEWREQVLGLKGKVLGCFCVKKDGTGACHGFVYVEWLDGQT